MQKCPTSTSYSHTTNTANTQWAKNYLKSNLNFMYQRFHEKCKYIPSILIDLNVYIPFQKLRKYLQQVCKSFNATPTHIMQRCYPYRLQASKYSALGNGRKALVHTAVSMPRIFKCHEDSPRRPFYVYIHPTLFDMADKKLVFCCVVACIQPDFFGCQQDFLVV